MEQQTSFGSNVNQSCDNDDNSNVNANKKKCQLCGAINDLRWNVYTTINPKQQQPNILADRIKELLFSKTADDGISDGNCPIALKESIIKMLTDIKPQDKFLWLSSKYKQNIYPPININETGGIVPKIVNSQSIATHNPKYNFSSPLKIETDGYEGIPLQQNPDLSDCSFITSLINLKNYYKDKYNPPVCQVRNCQFKYLINFYFNGSDSRLVCIDTTQIPTDRSGEQLTLNSSNFNHKILEIAYLKLKYNSFDSTGSNTGIDTFLLSGFIPEFRKINTVKWDLVEKYFNSKCCTLALGISENNFSFQNKTWNLKANHDYSIVNVESRNKKLDIVDPLYPDKIISISEWQDVVDIFDTLYVNWDYKKLFRRHEKFHFRYNVQDCNRYRYDRSSKPCFTIRNKVTERQLAPKKQENTVYLLLERHLNDNPGNCTLELFDSITSEILNIKEINNTGFYLIKTGIIDDNLLKACCYSDITASFTVHAYSLLDIEIKKFIFPNIVTIEDIFLINAPLNTSTYCKNTTFKLNIKKPSAETENGNVTINISLFSENVKTEKYVNLQIFHINDFEFSKPLIPKHDYLLNVSTVSNLLLNVNSTYKIVCSSLDSQIGEKFKLIVEESSNLAAAMTLSKYYNYHGGIFKTTIKCTSNFAICQKNNKGYSFEVKLTSKMNTMPDTWNLRLYKEKMHQGGIENMDNVGCDIKWSFTVINSKNQKDSLLFPNGMVRLNRCTASNIVINHRRKQIDNITVKLNIEDDINTYKDYYYIMEIGSLYELRVLQCEIS
ncbi:uncharacterized protein SCODWIG_02168 [Saccharomycodes ludwigii]|uniref:Cysteine protease RIM13 n=1 Tax=Saccharomycodes ludwigii TaxID=36035 RepID=A0A376B6S5_9ASCO|nr:uncharacterized protein SCODWIG_02168 [Saccharomycodes ludwigii]